MTENPFKPANKSPKRLKMFLYGPEASGKTLLSLQANGVTVLDTERSTQPYRDEDAKFHVHDVTSFKEAVTAVDYLADNKHDYRTLVIDPITTLWDSCQQEFADKRWEEEGRLPVKDRGAGWKESGYYVQINDWIALKRPWKKFMRLLTQLDMNIILTAHQKNLYADSGVMKKIGVTFDGEKDLPYVFDTTIRMEKTNGKYLCTTLKQRVIPGKPQLPEIFETSFKVFSDLYGEALTRESKPIEYCTTQQQTQIGLLVETLKLTPTSVKEALKNYHATRVSELLTEDADIIIGKLEKTVASKVGHAKNINQVEGPPMCDSGNTKVLFMAIDKAGEDRKVWKKKFDCTTFTGNITIEQWEGALKDLSELREIYELKQEQGKETE